MKYSIWFIGCLVIFSLIGCFDDKGTYDYKDLNEPIWNTGCLLYTSPSPRDTR